MALLYPRSTKLQAYLLEYFIVVVALCRHIHQFGQKSTIGQLTSAINDAKLQAFRSDLDQWAMNIKEETSLHEHQENSGFRAVFKKISETSSQQQNVAAKLRILDFCSTYNHQTSWKQTKKAGRTSFFEQRIEYQTWRDSTKSCTLVCTGKLGSGKSVLLANIVDDLTLSSGNQDYMVTYFFCRDNIPESLQARTVIGSLARQMLCNLPNLVQLSDGFDVTQPNADTDAIVELLIKCLRLNRKAYVILDGLDECDEVEQRALLTQLLKLQNAFKVIICTSVRLEPHVDPKSITRRLADSCIFLMPDDNPDINSFIATELDRCLDERRLVLGDPKLILDIEDALVKGSQGMFLWATLQIQSLCGMKTDQAIREALADLPKDLPEIFRRILEKSGRDDRILQGKVLRLVIAACRPLTTDELREALSVTPGYATWDPSKVLNDVYSALACCGCLIIVDEEELTVSFVHHSFRQYILGGSIGNSLFFTLGEAHRTVADIVVTYLGYGVFGTEVSTTRIQPVEAQLTPSRIIHATTGTSSMTAQLAQKLLRSRKQPAFDMSKVLAEARGAFSSKPGSAFKFHVYAKSHWSDHILYLSRNNAAIFKLATRLFRAETSKLTDVFAGKEKAVFEFALKTAEFYKRNRISNGEPLMVWAARQSIEELFEFLVGSAQEDEYALPIMDTSSPNQKGLTLLIMLELLLGKFDINATDLDGRTPLHWAAALGHPKHAGLLLDMGNGNVNCDAKDQMGQTPLICAASKGHKDMVELLLDTGMVDTNTKDGRLLTALGHAVRFYRLNVVELLLSRAEVNVEARDQNGWTPLLGAIFYQNTDIVELLLRNGRVDMEAMDEMGRTALAFAAYHGRKRSVELLLITGKANTNAKDNDGRTPKELATRRGYKDIVQLITTYESSASKE